MKKTIVISGMALSAVIAAQSAYAVAGNKEDRAAMRTDKQTEVAEKKAEKKTEIAEKKAEKVCERITTRVEKMKEKTAERKQFGTEKITERLTNVKERRTVRHEELAQRRTQRDAQRQAFYDSLMAKATTAEQKEAVKKFETTVEAAVVARRAAIDEATKKMQTDVDALITKKQDTIDQLFMDYKKAEDAAFAKAESACGDTSTETDLKSIAKTLNADLKTARDTFRAGVRDTRTMGTEIQQLAATKKQSVKESVDAFKVVVQQARIELQKAFGDVIDINVDSEEGNGVDVDE